MVKKYKKDDATSYALGATLTVELIKRRPEIVQAVYVSPRSDIAAVPAAARAHGIPVIESEKAINVLSPKGNCFAIGEFEKFTSPLSAERDHIVLVNPSDSGNLGTIIRLADWWGIRNVVCSQDCADCFNPKVVQATMGAILRVRVHYTDLGRYLAAHAAAGIPVYGTFLDGEDLYRADLTPAGIVVMGNEGRGVRPATAAGITRRLYIPPFPADRAGSESLNVAMAAGVVCAEVRRRMR